MKEAMVTLDRAGRLVVPAPFRRALGLAPGSAVMLHLREDGLHLCSTEQGLKRAQELVRQFVPAGVSLVDELLAERREASKRE